MDEHTALVRTQWEYQKPCLMCFTEIPASMHHGSRFWNGASATPVFLLLFTHVILPSCEMFVLDWVYVEFRNFLHDGHPISACYCVSKESEMLVLLWANAKGAEFGIQSCALRSLWGKRWRLLRALRLHKQTHLFLLPKENQQKVFLQWIIKRKSSTFWKIHLVAFSNNLLRYNVN